MDSATPQRLYGRGGGEDDGTQLQLRPAAAVEPRVENKATYAPFYWSTCGYAVLAAVNVTTSRADARPGGGTNVMPARYALSTDGRSVTWTWPSAASNPHGIELYLMPTATSMDAAMAAYYQLIGRPAVPPRWALGFMLCRYGWSNRSYVEQTLRTWRAGRYPADAFIMDCMSSAPRRSRAFHCCLAPSRPISAASRQCPALHEPRRKNGCILVWILA